MKTPSSQMSYISLQGVRDSSLKNSNQVRNTIEPNPITNPLKVIDHWLESQHFKTHDRGCETRHSHVSPNIHHQPISSFHSFKKLLDRGRNIWLPERLSFQKPHNVLVGLVRQRPKI
uniref:Uncharacterized protein n=1 Tax=Salix viminalis TaxID=40686 RepID=A0A6N2MGI5_SALVM